MKKNIYFIVLHLIVFVLLVTLIIISFANAKIYAEDSDVSGVGGNTVIDSNEATMQKIETAVGGKTEEITDTILPSVATPMSAAQDSNGVNSNNVVIEYVYTPVSSVESEITPDMVLKMTGVEKDIAIIAQMLYGECGPAMNYYEMSLAAWTVYNRLDMGIYGKDVTSIITAPYQFTGYKAKHPIDKNCYYVAKTVTWFYYSEKETGISFGRTLPKEFVNFRGDGRHNHFKDRQGHEYKNTLPNPYK